MAEILLGEVQPAEFLLAEVLVRWSTLAEVQLAENLLAEVQMTGVLLADVQLSEEFWMKSNWQKFNYMTWAAFLLAEVKVDDSGLELFNLDKLIVIAIS
jgi:hypothetical protein